MIKMHTAAAKELFERQFIWFPEKDESVEIPYHHIPKDMKDDVEKNKPIKGVITSVDGEYIYVQPLVEGHTKRTLEYYRSEIYPVGNFYFK